VTNKRICFVKMEKRLHQLLLIRQNKSIFEQLSDNETKDKTNNFITKKLFKLNKHRRVIRTELHKVGCVNPPNCDELRLFKSLWVFVEKVTMREEKTSNQILNIPLNPFIKELSRTMIQLNNKNSLILFALKN